MLKAHVADNWQAMGVSISVVQDGNEGADRLILRMKENERGRVVTTWERIENRSVAVDPSLELDYETARVLLAALHEHFKGPADARQLREDLDFERKRGEKMLDAVLSQHNAQTHLMEAGRR